VGDFSISRIATGFRNSPAFELIGSRGAVTFNMERPAEFNLFEPSTEEGMSGFRRIVAGPWHPYFNEVVAFPVPGVSYGYSETYVAQAFEFVRAVADGQPYEPDFADGVAAARVCDAVQRVAYPA
jgi:predicted dehydrogenase